MHDYKAAFAAIKDRALMLVGEREELDMPVGLVNEMAIRAALELADRMQWRPFTEVPIDEEVLLYCPPRSISNRERIELGYGRSSRGSYHSWATHWMPLPDHFAGAGKKEDE